MRKLRIGAVNWLAQDRVRKNILKEFTSNCEERVGNGKSVGKKFSPFFFKHFPLMFEFLQHVNLGVGIDKNVWIIWLSLYEGFKVRWSLGRKYPDIATVGVLRGVWQLASKMSPKDLQLLVPKTTCRFLWRDSGLTRVINRMWQKRVLSEANVIKCILGSTLNSESFLLEEASRHFVRTLQQPCGEACVERNWGLLTKASSNLPAMWVNYLGSGTSNASQAFRGLQPHESFWVRTTQLSPSWIPDHRNHRK